MLNKSYKIILSEMVVDTFIGILDIEKTSTQPIIIDLIIDLYLNDYNDDISDVLDYRIIRNIIIEESKRKHINLIETLADNILNRIFQEVKLINKITIKISKPMVFHDCKSISVEMTYYK
ncbi:hypothetical protein CKSOR_00046 [Candidatus Kinetoplastibacterium sorsogonicusi]|uniref:dihydroneopterin aldolase n=1 Tax=Candidatus Kinetoplastidibacterium kentomonadis TaxID=1576550 RepID=A0A3Q8EXX7_9PROT|nr:dihydroneopterin aldolase [Candidatus Kinetoplastibacterium sorsogonicusi]AWD32191.1 hypothetical protein CKSOR_00046 [Candidatus Kinetoplastibacterium sorsogonicusi]